MTFEEFYSDSENLWSQEEKKPLRNLVWRGGLDYPIEDPEMLTSVMTGEELGHLVPKSTFKSVWIDLLDPESQKVFNEIYQRCTDKWYTLLGEENFKVGDRDMKFIRYLESYYTIPPWLTQHVTSSHQSNGLLMQ